MAKSDFDTDLLLAYVRGELDADRSREIEVTAGSNAELAAEIALLQSLQATVREETAKADPGEFGWARLARSMDDRQASAEPKGFQAKRYAPWQVAAAAAIGAVAWHAASSSFIQNPPTDEIGYVPVVESKTDAFQLKVIFKENVAHGDVTDLLADMSAKIVDGPNALAFYVLAFESAEDTSDALATLREATEVVDTVQRN
ncbi:MAG: hypothetical protein AAF950_09635 [Pseudomonadota bacterium]